jgi:glycosyltransferase involved in cell wall biosynthesis
MTEVARVAILVACHNDRTLQETYESVRDEPGSELVIVDDESTDPAVLATLATMERNGIRVLHQKNSGPAAAWMAGLDATSAPYVMPFSSDDVLIRGATGLLADALDTHPHAAFAWGDIKTFGLARAYRPSVPALCPWLVTYTNCIPAYSLFRRSTLLQVGGWEYCNATEDWDLWMRLAAQGLDGVHIRQPVYLYRRSAGGRYRELGRGHRRYYGELQFRNAGLFAARPKNRANSPAPRPLKTLLPFVDALPGIPRLTKIQLSEALTLLFWSGGARRTTRIVAEGIAFRARLLARRGAS